MLRKIRFGWKLRTPLFRSPGQIAGALIESNTGYHIVKLENKKTKKEEDGSETVTFTARHILLQKAFEEPGSRCKHSSTFHESRGDPRLKLKGKAQKVCGRNRSA